MNKSLSLFIAVYRFNIYHLFFQLEDDTDPDQGRSVVVIFDFEVSDNQTSVSTALRPCDDYEDENSIPEMPWLDIAVADCNCSRYPELSDVAVRPGANIESSRTRSSDSDSDDSSEYEQEPEEENTPSQTSSTEVEEETLYTEYFKLKGSTYHEHFQTALRHCKTLTRNKTEIQLKLAIEPTNKEDENAIIVQAELDGMWKPVGYIPGVKVQKAMDAITKEEVRTVKFKSIEWKYIYGLGEFRYVSSITVTKVDRWLPSDKNYQYNDTF